MKRRGTQSRIRLVGASLVIIALIVGLAWIAFSGVRIQYYDSGIVPVKPAVRFHAALEASTPASEIQRMFKGDWYSISASYKGYDSAVHWAAAEGEIELLEVFLEEVPWLLDSQRARNIDAPIHSAIRGGQIKAVVLLLDRGADIQLTGSYALSALELAEYLESEEIAELIRQRR